MATSDELSRKRASYKGQLTVFTSYVDSLKLSSFSQLEASQLQLRIGKIESLYEQYDGVQLQLECITDLESQLKERADFELKYYTSLSKAQGILSEFNKKRDEFESCSGKGSRASSKSGNLVKLPTIQLPKFSGSYENWLEFHDTFSSLIHSNEDIEDINKFHYLRASLEGSAALVIKSIEFSSKNYEVAWELLCERFNNKRLLLQNHVSALFNVEPLTKECSSQLKRLIDNVNKNLRSLESLGEPVNHWDTLLIHIIAHKLDTKTYREWEEVRGGFDKNKPITFESFLTFMRNRADLIETLELSSTKGAGQAGQPSKSTTKHRTMIVSHSTANLSPESIKSCKKCSGDHALRNCPQFLALTNAERLQLLPAYKICYNCFKSGHYANRCSKPGCKVCKRKHNTLIHIAESKQSSRANYMSEQARGGFPSAPAQGASALSCSGSGPVTLSARVAEPHSSQGQDVLLSTALVKVYDANKCEHIARVILDSGSTSSIISDRMCSRLKLHTDKVSKSVQGINKSSSPVGKMCRVQIRSLDEQFSTHVTCFVLPSITDKLPSRQVDVSSLNIPSNIQLADPHFYAPSEVDLIIGADLFWDLLGSGKVNLGNGQPILHETRLGWLVSGPIGGGSGPTSARTFYCEFNNVISNNNNNELLNDDIQNQLTRFWQLEEVCPQSSPYSPEEKLCEDHFKANTTRMEDGRFCVRIPLKDDPNVLGESINRAKHCFLSLERRISCRPDFRNMYKDFMAEYRSLGHMTECKHPSTKKHEYFIPHHGVLRESSSTTKLRVVFNASSNTSSGLSLNKIQMVGPTVQDDLLSILLRFRQHKYIISADVEKMYRQITVHPDDRHLQQIIWRDDPSHQLKIYQLNTVTYGTASAPYLATRCLKQIGLDCEDKRVSEIIIHDFYVDDLLTGGDDLDDVLSIKNKISASLASACMNLRKWKSNEPQLISDSTQIPLNLNMGSAEPSKTLGLGWQPTSDTLHFPVGDLKSVADTKRDMLSVTAQIFDPLGILAPCVILMKILLQKLWVYKLSWDEQLPPEVNKEWNDLVSDLPALNDIRVPRYVLGDSHCQVECHVFTDASERAYGACLYLRSVNEAGEVTVRLLVGKSRVAPIKPTTIPRLELCGALTGARLYEKTMSSLKLNIKGVTFWTDSTIVLGWLKMLPCKLQPFVRNRTAEILDKTGGCTWRHVPTDENPADLISRGVRASLIQSLDLWWSGPSFLKENRSTWPVNPATNQSLPETRPNIVLHLNIQQVPDRNGWIDFTRFSNLSRLKRTVAYVLRFVQVCKKQLPEVSYLTDTDLANALNVIIRLSQRQSFPEYDMLLAGKQLPKKSPLIKFNVFLDPNLILRVGGRLCNSDFPYEKKHPALIQSTHRFSQLLFEYEHKRLLHAPPQLLLATIKGSYWPIGGSNLAKSCFRKCLKCLRMKGKVVAPIMGNLPKTRLSPGFPFENVGVDYAGPMSAASRQGRGCRLVKVYIAIFVCFTTKAIHLELVGDLTSKSYLLALRRFVSRRGKPKCIYSDNGTSFVGACNELSTFLKNNSNLLSERAANDEISFHFVPAFSPHFGGLWEAGVKATKFHLKRVLGNCNLTYEELNTVLVQVESILNSRPLTPLSTDPEDLLPLTPGHFLIGRPFTSLPERNYREDKPDRLTRYQRIEQLRQHFWARWSKEYVSDLQIRTKWQTGRGELQLGTLVLLKDDQLPPLKWKLGRVIAVHPGADGINRVADMKIATGTVRRSFSKICPLPVYTEVG